MAGGKGRTRAVGPPRPSELEVRVQNSSRKRESFQPLLFAPPQGEEALPETVRPQKTWALQSKLVRAVEASPFPESYVRLRDVDAADDELAMNTSGDALRSDVDDKLGREVDVDAFLDALCDEQLTFSMRLSR